MITDALTIDVLVINSLADALVDIGVDMLADVDIIVVTPTVIGVEFALAL